MVFFEKKISAISFPPLPPPRRSLSKCRCPRIHYPRMSQELQLFVAAKLERLLLISWISFLRIHKIKSCSITWVCCLVLRVCPGDVFCSEATILLFPWHPRQEQSRKNPVSASAMLTGKFLQIRKVFVKVHYWLKNFWIRCNTKYPDIQISRYPDIQISVLMNWKVSGQSKQCLDNLENVSG